VEAVGGGIISLSIVPDDHQKHMLMKEVEAAYTEAAP
jgi:hypothetical protein